MLHARKATDVLNDLIDVVEDFDTKRRHLSPLTRQRIDGLVSKIPKDSDQRIIAEMMRDLFYRDFKAADAWIDEGLRSNFVEDCDELNLANGLFTSYRVPEGLERLLVGLSRHKDNSEYLYTGFEQAQRFGLCQTADRLATLMEKANFETPSTRPAIAAISRKFEELGLTDQLVAEYLEKAFTPLKNYLEGKPEILHAIRFEFQEHAAPSTLNFTIHIDRDVEEIVEVSENIAEHLAEHDFPDSVEEHITVSAWSIMEDMFRDAS